MQKVLSAALDTATDPSEPVMAYRQVSQGRLERKLAQARVIAERRSGARGSKARQFLISVENEITESEAKSVFHYSLRALANLHR